MDVNKVVRRLLFGWECRLLIAAASAGAVVGAARERDPGEPCGAGERSDEESTDKQAGDSPRESAAMRKKIDPRIRTLIENCVKKRERALYVIIGDKGREQGECFAASEAPSKDETGGRAPTSHPPTPPPRHTHSLSPSSSFG